MNRVVGAIVVTVVVSIVAVGSWQLFGLGGDRCKAMTSEEASEYVMSSIADGFRSKTTRQIGGLRSAQEISVAGVERNVRVPGDEYYTVTLASKHDGRTIGDVDVYRDCTLGWFVPDK